MRESLSFLQCTVSKCNVKVQQRHSVVQTRIYSHKTEQAKQPIMQPLLHRGACIHYPVYHRFCTSGFACCSTHAANTNTHSQTRDTVFVKSAKMLHVETGSEPIDLHCHISGSPARIRCKDLCSAEISLYLLPF